MEQWIRTATDYKIDVVPDTGGTRPCIECPSAPVSGTTTTICLCVACVYVHVMCVCGGRWVGRGVVMGVYV